MSERQLREPPVLQLFNDKQPKTDIDLYRIIRTSAELGEKRDPIPDMQSLLKFNRLILSPSLTLVPLDSAPILFVPNHFSRGLSRLKYPFTTEESLLDAAVTTLSAVYLFHIDEKIPWVQKRLRPNPLDIRKVRQTQNAAIDCYDYIPIDQDNFLSTIRGIVSCLQNFGHIGMFAEHNPSYTLGKSNPSFPRILELIQSRISYLQIIPVSINIENQIANVMFSKPIIMSRQDDSTLVTQNIMMEIAKGLPSNLQGDYRQHYGW